MSTSGHWFQLAYSSISLFIIANAIFDLLPISSGLVIGAGVLACVGLGYLFPDKDKKEDK